MPKVPRLKKAAKQRSKELGWAKKMAGLVQAKESARNPLAHFEQLHATLEVREEPRPVPKKHHQHTTSQNGRRHVLYRAFSYRCSAQERIQLARVLRFDGYRKDPLGALSTHIRTSLAQKRL